MTPDQTHPNEGAHKETEAFLAGWWHRAEQFRAVLAAEDGPISIQLGPDEDVTYVQARHEDDGWFVEAVSNNYLPEHTQLSVDDECTLLELGWEPPTGPMPNFFRFYDDPVDLLGVAADIMIAFAAGYHATPEGPFLVSPAHLVDAPAIDGVDDL